MAENQRETFDPLLIAGDGPTEKRHVAGDAVYLAIEQLSLTRQAVVSDLKTVRWKTFVTWVLILGWIVVIGWTLGFIVASTPYWISSNACHPDGNFDPFTKYDMWASSGLFQITLSFGNLSFTQAKVIDVVWDVVVGRGGQAIIAYISWRVVSIYVASSMQVTPVTYRTFRTFFLDREPSLVSSIHLISDFTRRRGLQSRLATAFIMLVVSFALIFPTLASAMTGYTPRIQGFIADADGNWIGMSHFRPVLYVIHDGPRVNLSVDYPVLLDDKEFNHERVRDWFDQSLYNSIAYCFETSTSKSYSSSPPDTEVCNLQTNVSNYVAGYGFYGLTDRQTWWYGTADMVDGFSEQPAYRWGFSFLQLFVMLVLLNFWGIGLYIMWAKGHFTLKMRGSLHTPLNYKAVLELADALRAEMQEQAHDADHLTNDEIELIINKQMNGGKLISGKYEDARSFGLVRGIWDWVKKESSWAGVLIVLLRADITMSMVIPLGLRDPGGIRFWELCLFFTPGYWLALVAGQTTRSRIVFVAGALAVSAIITGLIEDNNAPIIG